MNYDLPAAIAHFNVRDYALSHGGEQVQGSEWSLVCPSCGKRKLIVNDESKRWHCWVCEKFVTMASPMGPVRRAVYGAGGIVDLVMFLEKVDHATAIRFIRACDLGKPAHLSAIPDISLENPGIIRHANQTFQTISPPASYRRIEYEIPYLRERGISLPQAQDFRLMYCTEGQYANRLVFPVYAAGDRLLYWQARAMWAARPGERYTKSLNPPKSANTAVSSDVLLNLDRACRYPFVVVTEGPIDCIHAGDDAVCTFGKRLHPPQVAALLRAEVRRIVFMWDADAHREATETARWVAPLFDEVRVVYLPEADPGTFSREWLRPWIDGAVPVPRTLYPLGGV